MDENAVTRLWLPWGKSNAAGRPHSVLGHLLDAGSTAELIWRDFLAPRSRDALDALSDGRGRDVLVLLAAWHDLGKFTPAFQVKALELTKPAVAAGFGLPVGAPSKNIWHGPSGAEIADRVLKQDGAAGHEWLIHIIAGHHGSFRAWDRLACRRNEWQRGHRTSARLWVAAQEDLARHVASLFDIEVASLRLKAPPLMLQLAAAGWVSMADWIASSDLFPGLGQQQYSVDTARERAAAAWARLGLGQTHGRPSAEPFEQRFGMPPRPLQEAIVQAAHAMSEPGLMVVEAPMGEGKTEAAFAATEVMVERFGLEGYLFAMPTQGTTDAMYARCLSWAGSWTPDETTTLLHGKAMANETWRQVREPVVLTDVCDIEDDDLYGAAALPSTEAGALSAVPAEWLLGRHRGLLSRQVVGTVDQPLIAATHIKYVALRAAGLVGKVVVIDEVHSYDVDMSRYLHQFLGWCRDGGIPVILMSATLPPTQRRELLEAYAAGVARGAEPPLPDVVAAPGYPCITTWVPSDGLREVHVAPHSLDRDVHVAWAPLADPEDTGELAELVAEHAAGGGCVLVILNTVRRAQEVYAALRAEGVDVVLLHGRLTTGARAARTASLVAELGGGGARPARRVVVATQIAEQSFDVDADLLITDVAPMDLLLQRIGRLHRHASNDARRPESLRRARVLVTGVRQQGESAPGFPKSFEYVYDRHALLRTALLIGAGRAVAVPSDIPGLVAAAYADEASWPPAWADDAAAALSEAQERRRQATLRADAGVLRPAERDQRTLEGLHSSSGVERRVERITVRDGEPSVELALVRWDAAREVFTTLGGRLLGPNGERAVSDDVGREVLADTVRVRQSERLTDDPGGLAPLPGWVGSDLLRSQPALVLDVDGRASGAWGSATYDDEIGLVIERNYAR